MGKSKWAMVVAIIVVLAAVAVAYAAGKAKAVAPKGFSIREIRFDESVSGEGSKPLPIIPRMWRFVGVSNGESVNSNILWFQDRDGHIYGVAGFTTEGGKFILNETIYKITAGD